MPRIVFGKEGRARTIRDHMIHPQDIQWLDEQIYKVDHEITTLHIGICSLAEVIEGQYPPEGGKTPLQEKFGDDTKKRMSMALKKMIEAESELETYVSFLRDFSSELKDRMR